MSTQIEFDRKAYKLTKIYEDKHQYKDEYYILTAKVGSNNVLDYDGNIAKNWTILKIGNYYECMRNIIDMSKSCEGGSLRYQNGRTKPENFIKRWRKVIQNAGTYNDFTNDFSPFEIVSIDSNDKVKISKFEKVHDMDNWRKDEEKRGYAFNPEKIFTYKRPLKRKKDMLKYIQRMGDDQFNYKIKLVPDKIRLK